MFFWRKTSPDAPGKSAERLAQRYLEKRGYRLIAANPATRFGEVDLVMETRDTVVFVEVRERAHAAFGAPAETVDRRKQARIAKAALAFAKAKGLMQRNLRFDIIAVEAGQITHLENAFVPSQYTY